MAKQVVKLGLEFDTKAAIQSYRDLVSEMSKGGANPKAIKQFTAAIEKAETELAQLAAEGSTGFTDSKSIEQYQKKVLKTVTSMQQLALRMQEFSKSGENFPTSEVKKLEAEIEKLKKKIVDAQKAAKEGLIKSLTTNGGFSKKEAEAIAETVKTEEQLIAKLEEEKKLRDEIRKAAQPAAEKATNAIKDKAAARATSGSQVVMDAVGMKGRKGVKDIREAVATALQEGIKKGWSAEDIKQNALEAMKKAGISEKLAKEFEASFNLKTIETELKRVQDDINKNSSVKKYNEANKSYNQIAGLSAENFSQFTTKSKEVTEAQEKLAIAESKVSQVAVDSTAAQKKMSDAAGQQAGKAEQAANKFMDMSDAQKENLKSTEELEGGFNRLADRLKYMFGFTAMFNKLRQVIRSTFNDIQELDKAYASIAYVTNETVGDLWSTYGEYAGMAEKLGQSTVDVVKASAIYRQQGLDTAEALELTTDTMKLATIAGNDYSTATQEMTAALRGFKMEMDEGGHVSDVYSELAAHAAASVDDIAQAMSRTASIANSAGMSFENTSAFLTQMIETTQESAENIGTSMKTIIARFTELKKNIAGTAESEFDDLEMNKVQTALKAVGISLTDAQHQFRDLDDVFLELSEKWSTLDRNTQRYIATVAAGSRQQSRFIALMDNYERTAELIDIAADSEGKADEQFAKAADTIEFKLNAIKTKWEEFKLSIMNSDFVKGLLNSVNSFMDNLKNVKMPKVAIFSTFAILAAKNFVLTFINTIKKSVSSFKTIGKFIGNNISKHLPKIKLGIDREQLQAQLNEANENLKAITAEKEQHIRIVIDKDLELKSLEAELAVTIDKLKELALEGKGAETEADKLREKKHELEAQIKSLNEVRDKEKEKIAELSGQQQQEAAKSAEAQEKLAVADQIASASTQLVTQSLRAGITALSGWASGVMDGEQALKTFALSLVATLGQITLATGAYVVSSSIRAAANKSETLSVGVLKIAIDALKGSLKTMLPLLGAIAGIAAVAGIAAGIMHLVKQNQENNKSTADQLANQEKQLQTLRAQSSELTSQRKNEEKELKNVEELRKKYDKLHNLRVRTTEQQEEYNSLVEELQEKYPELVRYYDQTTGQLELQTNAWDTIVNSQKESLELLRQQELIAKNAVINKTAQKERTEARAQLAKNAGLDDSDVKNLTSEDDINDLRKKVQNRLNMASYGAMYLDGDKFKVYGGNSTYTLDIDAEKLAQAYGLSLDDSNVASTLQASILGDQGQAYIDLLNDKLTQLHVDNEAIKKQEQENFAKSYSESIAKNNSDITDSQKKAAEMMALTAAKINDMSAMSSQDYMYRINNGYYMEGLGDDVRNKGFYNQLGGARAGASDNDLSSWDTINNNKDRKIAGLSEYGINNVGDVIRILTEIEGSEAAAKKYYEEHTEGADKQEELFDYVTNAASANINTAKADELVAKYSQKYTDQQGVTHENGKLGQLDAIYTQLAKEGLTVTELDQLEETITNLFAGPARQTLLDGYVNAERDAITAAQQEAKEYGLQSFSNMTANQIRAYTQSIKDIGEKIGGEDGERQAQAYAEAVNRSLKNQGVKDSLIDQFYNMVDFTEYNPLTSDKFKKDAVDSLQETYHISASQAETIYEDAFKEAVKNGLTNPESINAIQVGEFTKNLKEAGDAIEKNIKPFQEYIGMASTQVKVGADKYGDMLKSAEELAKVGINIDVDSVVRYDSALGSYVLNAKALNSMLEKNLELDKEGLETSKKANKERLLHARQQLAEQKITQEEYDAIETEVEETDSALNEAERILQRINRENAEALRYANSIEGKVESIGKKLSGVSSISKQFLSDGFLDTSSITALKEIANKEGKDISAYFNGKSVNSSAMFAALKAEAQKAIDESTNNYDRLLATAQYNEIVNAEAEYQEEAKKKTDDKTKSLKDLADAQKDVTDKQKALNEAIEAYNKLLYGSEYRQSGLDLLYNYKEAISAFSDEMTRAQELIENSKSVEESVSALSRYTNAAHQRLAYMNAQGERYDAGLATRRNQLLGGATSYTNELTGNTTTINFGDYVRYNADTGLMALDQKLIQDAKIADEWKDYIEKQVDDYNKISQESLKNQDEIRKLEQEIQKRREDAIKKYADFEKDIAETLKAQYQEQVDNLKNKYDSMKEADDDYLDALQEAIDKQRKLRERENKWEDLAQKEKKLSLMSRDTSGANAIETQKLEKEIQGDRETLLDESIDSAIENMQKLAEKQDELRQTEIELKEALLENTMYWNQQAEGVAQGFETAEDYVAWFTQTATGLNEQTAAQFEVTMNEARDKFQGASEEIAWRIQDDMSQTGDSVTETITVTSDEVKSIVATTSDTFVDEVTNTFERTKKSFNENMDSAIEKIHSAQDALQQAINKLNETAAAANAAAEAERNYRNAHLDNEENEWQTGAERDARLNSLKQALLAGDESGNAWTEEKFINTYSNYVSDAKEIWDLYSNDMNRDNRIRVRNDLLSMGLNVKENGTALEVEGGAADTSLQEVMRRYGFQMGGRVGGSDSYPIIKYVKQYAQGGLVNYTGPAWVDGSSARPEAFLSAEDTERIGNAAKLLADIPSLSRSNISTSNQTYGDTNIEINLNIDHISSDVDVDEMLERVKQEIVDVARPIGTNVILQQQV